jgi:hypothetical protein
MKSVRSSRFKNQDEAIRHMVQLLAAEGKSAGIVLTDQEQDILAGECILPEALREKARTLIGRIFDRETELDDDPHSFSNSLPSAGGSKYPNIAALTEELARERNPYRRLRGWDCVRDRLQLIEYGLLAVLLMLLIVGGLGVYFSK